MKKIESELVMFRDEGQVRVGVYRIKDKKVGQKVKNMYIRTHDKNRKELTISKPLTALQAIRKFNEAIKALKHIKFNINETQQSN